MTRLIRRTATKSLWQRPTTWFLLLGVALNGCGWLLSLLQQVNPTGYLISALLVLVVVVALIPWRALSSSALRAAAQRAWSRLRRHCRQPLPRAFFALNLLVLAGAVLYPPNNADALTQRIPRVLHWLAAGRWHWIDTPIASLNTRACGWEWLIAPVLAFTRSDRWLFGFNFIAFLQLPGLLFSLLVRLGISRRVAWHWMWLLPSGYCFILQAGGLGNDATAAVFAVAAVDFALRARESHRSADVWLSILAAALFTSMKATNLPLLLPWVVAVWPAWRLLLPRPLLSFAVIATAILVSFMPVAILNAIHCGDWTGATSEGGRLAHINPGVGLVGNALNLTIQNLVPPVFPLADWWNAHAHLWLPAGWQARLIASFEPGGANLRVAELQVEDVAGLGAGVCLLLLVSLVTAHFVTRRRRGVDHRRDVWLVATGSGIALLVYMSKLGLSTAARLVAPYYFLLVPALLLSGGHSRLTRRPWWRALSLLVMAGAAVVLVANPARPLWPAHTGLSWLQQAKVAPRVVERASLVYAVYGQRWDALASVRDHLPDTARVVGFINLTSGATMEASLWRPFGQRQIEALDPQASAENIRARGVQYVVIGTEWGATPEANATGQEWLAAWLRARGATVISQTTLRVLASRNPSPWYVVSIPPVPASPVAAVPHGTSLAGG